MPTNRQDFLTIASGVVAVVGGLFAAFYYLARTLDATALAITLVLIVMFGLLIGAPFLWLIARLTRDRRAEIEELDKIAAAAGVKRNAVMAWALRQFLADQRAGKVRVADHLKAETKTVLVVTSKR